jgi:hypothetical protein
MLSGRFEGRVGSKAGHHDDVEAVNQENSNRSAKFKAFTANNQTNAPQTVATGQAAAGGFAIVASLLDVNILNGAVIKSARGGDAENVANIDNHMNMSNDN